MEEQNVYHDQSRRNYYWKVNDQLPPVISTLNYNYPLVIPGITDNGPLFKYPTNGSYYIPFRPLQNKPVEPYSSLQRVENLIQGKTDAEGGIAPNQMKNIYNPMYQTMEKEQNKRNQTQEEFLKLMNPVTNKTYYRGIKGEPVIIELKHNPNQILNNNTNPSGTNIPNKVIDSNIQPFYN